MKLVLRSAVAVIAVFSALAAAAKAKFVEKLESGANQKLVCYGTSLTVQSHWWVDGLSAELAKRWPGQVTVVNAGQSGKNSAYGLEHVAENVTSKNPDAVMIEFSMNDAADSLNSGKTPAEALADAESNLRGIILAVTNANPACEIILETMNPYVAKSGSGLSNRTGLEDHIAMYRRVAEEGGFTLVDNWPNWLRVLAGGEAAYLELVPDGVHPNETGCNQVILPNVMRSLGLPVLESAREIPLIKDVDVAVVGGTFAGVSAAVAAKSAGASVFLVAPRRALAEEIVLPRRIVRPAADETFGNASLDAALPQGFVDLSFSYTASETPTASGKTDPNNEKLKDGKRGSAADQSVQYDTSPVLWTLTLTDLNPTVGSVVFYYYVRSTGGDFDVGSVSLEYSTDGSSWSAVSATPVHSVVATEVDPYHDDCHAFTITAPSPIAARYFRLSATRASGATRILAAEIAVRGTSSVDSIYTPIAYEKALDRQLLDAGIAYFTGAQACDVLRDGSGKLSGIVIADRSGRQAIRAKTVIDASEKGVIARKLASLKAVPGGNESVFEMTVVAKAGLDWSELTAKGYTVSEGAATTASVSLWPSDLVPSGADSSYSISRYTISRTLPLASGSWLELNGILHTLKDDCWTPSLVDWSEVPYYVTPDRIVGTASISAWTDAASAPLGAFVPDGVDHLFVLSQASDIDRSLAVKMSLPGVEWRLGARVGAAAAADPAGRGAVGSVEFGAAVSPAVQSVSEVLERPLGIGALDSGSVASLGGTLPVLGSANVIVTGMGTAGGPALIAAGDANASSIGLDFLYTMGGVTTDGRIGRYYKGDVRGFTKNTLDAGVKAKGWVFSQAKAEWLRTAARNAGGRKASELVFGVTVEGVVLEGTDGDGRSKVRGVVAVLPDGTRGVVTGSAVIDATGNADITAAAGGATMFLDATEFSMQGCGTGLHPLGRSYFNTDFGFLNSPDAGDLHNFGIRARYNTNVSRYNTGDPMSASRERRRIVGDIVVNERDVVNRRTWSDTIMHGKSDFDMHGFSVSELMMFRDRPHGTEFRAELPYRALLPATLDGVLATGLGISATRDAMPILRMQPDVQNQGYAAGLAAAASVTNGNLRAVGIRSLQTRLVALGNLDSSVLSHTDGSVTDAQLQSAVTGLSTNNFAGLEKILERPNAAVPLLKAAYAGTEDGSKRLACAIALVLAGDNTYLADVIDAAEEADWSKGYNFQGLGNYGIMTGPADYLAYALAASGSRSLVADTLADMADKLVASNGDPSFLSHFRILTLAVEKLESQKVFDSLTNAIARSESIMGHSVSSPASVPAHDTDGNNNTIDDAERTASIRELAVARTLNRAGVQAGTDSLEAYENDARTIYGSWAKLALAMPPLALTDEPEPEPEVPGVVNVDDNAVKTFEEDYTFDGNASKTGGGKAVFEAGFNVNAFAVNAGEVDFAADVGTMQVFKADALANGSLKSYGGNFIGFATCFTVNKANLKLTHLGVFESTGTGFTRLMRVYLIRVSDNKKVAAVQFSDRNPGFLRGGYRFIRLAQPFELVNGSSYKLCAFGFNSVQKYYAATDGSTVQALDTGSDALSFDSGVWKTTDVNGTFSDPVEGNIVSSGIAAGSMIISDFSEVPNVSGEMNVAAGATVKVSSPALSTGSITGSGNIVVDRSGGSASLSVNIAANATAQFAGSVSGTTAADRASLVKYGKGVFELSGENDFKDGVYVHEGEVHAASVASIGSEAAVYFSDFNTERGYGVISFAAPTNVFTAPVYALKYGHTGLVNGGFCAPEGTYLAISNTVVRTLDDKVTLNNNAASFGLIAKAPASGNDADSPVIDFVSNKVDYVDFYCRIDGKAGDAVPTRYSNKINIHRLEPSTSLRKFTLDSELNEKCLAGTVEVTGGEDNVIPVDYFDFTGFGPALVLRDGVTIVANNIRFSNSAWNGSTVTMNECNADITIAEGAGIVANGIPTGDSPTMNNTTNTVVRMDGGFVQPKSGNANNMFHFQNGSYIDIMNGGALFKLNDYDNGANRTIALTLPMTSSASGECPVTFRGSDPAVALAVVKTPMTYNGPTIVDNAKLELRKTLKAGSGLKFANAAALKLTNEGSGTITNAFGLIDAGNASGVVATVDANTYLVANGLNGGYYGFTKSGAGTMEIYLDGADASAITGKVGVAQGTLRITGAGGAGGQAATLVADGTFEPATALSGDRGSLDKRSVRDASYFNSNLTSWTFSADNNGSGICANGSYFSNNSQITGNGESNAHCAFVRIDNSKNPAVGPGEISRTVTAPAADTVFTVKFQLAPRWFPDSNWGKPNGFYGRMALYVDNRETPEYTSPTLHSTSETFSNWLDCTVSFTVAEAGDHVIKFRAVLPDGEENYSDMLIDNVKVGYSLAGGDRAAQLAAAEFDLAEGTTIALDDDFNVRVASFRYNGQRLSGEISAARYPQFVTGVGKFNAILPGFSLILK